MLERKDYDYFSISLIFVGILYLLEGPFSEVFGFMRFFPWYAVAAIYVGIYGMMRR